MKIIVNRGWYPTLITVLAVLGVIYKWPVEWVAPALIFILALGLVVTGIKARERQLERAAFRLRQLAEYFHRRFMGDSTLSIFIIIDSLFNIDNPKLWDWARACDMSQRIFNSWCTSFIDRMESDIGVTKLADYLSTYLNELWQITSHYSDFVEQFYEIAAKVEIPKETIDQYHKFVMEYNAFAQNFREHITELKSIARTGIEPPSVKMAKEVVKVG
ncbi:MAG TPA: hypothetical protein G4O20_03160 [Dehalococcoidia bacterium]|nr:hypothetical protein [Dehalococcoidia bacterium]